MLTYYAPEWGFPKHSVCYTVLNTEYYNQIQKAIAMGEGRTPSDSFMFVPGVLTYDSFAPGGIFGHA